MDTDSQMRRENKMSTTGHATRQSILIEYGHRHLAMHHSREKFAEELAANYIRLVPEGARGLVFKELRNDMNVAEWEAAKQSNSKLVQRYFNQTTHFPAELEEAWIATLDPSLKKSCVFALYARYGVIPMEIPKSESIESLSMAMTESAEAVTASAPMWADAKLDEDDRGHARHAHQQHMEAAVAHLGIAKKIRETFPEECAPIVRLKTIA